MTEKIASTPRLRLIGHFDLFDSRGRELPISARKNRVLIAALALAPEGRLAREALATLVWGDRGEAQARGSLRQALAVLRKEVAPLGPDIIVAGADSVGLDVDAIEVDVRVLRRAVATGDPALVERAAAYADAPLLTDLALSHCWPFWSGVRRPWTVRTSCAFSNASWRLIPCERLRIGR